LGSLLHRYRNLSLRAKFALPIALFVVLLFGALIPGVLYLQTRTVLDGARERGLQLTSIFAHSSVQAVVTDDFLVLRQIINSIASEEDVLYAMILDSTGLLLVHSDMRESGRTYTDALSARAAASTDPLVQEAKTGAIPMYDIAVPIYVLNQRRAVARVGLSLEREWAGIRRTRNLILGLGVLALAVGLGLATWQARSVTRPVRELAEGAQEIAAGNLDRLIAVGAMDEVGRLGETFNRMAASLKARWEIDRDLSSTLDLDSVLETITRHARGLLGADIAYVAAANPATRTATIAASAGAQTDVLRDLRITAGRGLGGQVLATGRAVTVADCATDPLASEHGDLLRREGIVSALVVPISLKGRTTGLLYVANRRPTVFSRQDEDTLNHLATQAAIAIENARLYEEITKHAEDLEAKVEARTRELQETNRRLEAASRHKSEFLANMSHELRTPLNAIIGFTRLVMRRSKDVLPAKQYENLEKITLSADQLLLLINDVLDLSKIEAGRMDVRPVSFALEPLIDACLRTVEPMVRTEQIQLAKDLEADLPRLHTDEDKLKQILTNLLSNAIKFTEAGTITVSARRHGDQVALSVIDPGIGIPEDALKLIFEEFRQVDSSSTRRHGGTGLGLSISQHFARLLGGDVTVKSALGRGSTFTLTIPMRYQLPEPTQQAAQTPAALKPADPSSNGKLMLAIDDDPDAIYLLRENLIDAGYRVVGALSAEEGLEKARTLRPFAITLDIMMPHRDGWEVLRDLKADPITTSIPVIVVSVVDSKEPAYRLGAFDYLVKPFEREAILRALERIPPGGGRTAVGHRS
jgi:signal transduction histidine kinase/CheY-like chemotaxis protein